MASTLLDLEKRVTKRRTKTASKRARPGKIHTPAQRNDEELSEGLYAAGEHSLSGQRPKASKFPQVAKYMESETYPLGQAKGGSQVEFRYHEILAMADLYENWDDMNSASHAELMRLRTYVRKSTANFKKKLAGSGKGGDAPLRRKGKGDDPVFDRYINLAMLNYAHFAPSDPSLAPDAGRQTDNRALWTQYHSEALALVRSGGATPDLDRALTKNAFGDHFLTDAFSAGHQFNKEDVTRLFNSQLQSSSGKLTPAGEKFFKAVAAQGLKRKPVKAMLSKYQKKTWLPDWLMPNLDKTFPVNVFETFLKKIHEAKPNLIGDSLVAKIIHDALGKVTGGLPVKNGLGEQWKLPGDDQLDAKTLELMRQAVEHSVYNVVVGATQSGDFSKLADEVWQHVPKPTASGIKIIQGVLKTYANPASPGLHFAAGEKLEDHIEVILEAARKQGKLEYDR